MAELIISKDEVVGIKKEIEEGSLELIFNALQSDIYSFPIKSFIRETISNGLDSIIEKDVFRQIKGGDPVEKYFLQRQDNELLKDSEYDPTYYTDKFLSGEDVVTVLYESGTPRDKVIIRDNGVGLGGKRLRGYFKIGWSSKRNFLTARGLYGLGSKSALATGIDYFIMTTVYNGYKTSFMIYNRDYENITPDTSTGKTDVWTVTMANNQVIEKNIYWEKTNELNSVSIEVEVKKHNRDSYINAVKDQFQYFNGKVNLGVKDSTGFISWDKLNELPEFESDNILIPKYSTYSNPHILVDGISYGLVSWAELELEERKGKIALKVSANQVDITQSRESLKWTDKTKNTILHAIRIAEDEASEFVRTNIKTDDTENIFAINDAYSVMSGYSSNSVINTFSKFLQVFNIKPKYTIQLDEKRKIVSTLSDDLFNFLFYSFDFKRVYTYTDGKKLKIKSENVTSFNSITGHTLILSEEISLGPKLANHLLEKFNVSSLIYIRENKTRVKDFISIDKHKQDYKTSDIKDYALNLIKKYNDLYLDTYDVVYDESVEEIDDVVLEDNVVNAAKVRKLNKQIMWYEYVFRDFGYGTVTLDRYKKECIISELKETAKGKEIIVVPSAYTKLGKMLVMMNSVSKPNSNFKVVFVAEENIKYFTELGGTHIENYFRTLNTNTGELMIGDKLVELNTTWQIKRVKEKYENFSAYSDAISALSTINKEKYISFDQYRDQNIREIMCQTTKDTEVVEEIFSYLNILAEFQSVVESKDKDLISKKALELFNTDTIYNVYAYDKNYVDSVEQELERLSSIAPIISSMGYYNEACTPLLEILLKTIHNNL